MTITSKLTWLPLRIAAAALVAAVAWLAAVSYTQADQHSVFIGSLTEAPGGGITATLNAVAPPEGIGAHAIDIVYNNSVATATACTTSAPGLCNKSYKPDIVRFAGINAPQGLTGEVEFGTITFQINETGGSLTLNIQVVTLTDPALKDLTPGLEVINSTTDSDSPAPTVAPTPQSASADTGDQPADTSGQPADTSGQPVNTSGQSANTSGQPADTSGQPADTSGQPADTSIEGPQTITEGQVARFQVSGYEAAGSDTRYQWTYGDGTSESTDSPSASHEFSSPGTYEVTVTVIDDEGERSSVTQYIQVEDRKWPLSRAQMIGIVIGGVFGLLLLFRVTGTVLKYRRSRIR